MYFRHKYSHSQYTVGVGGGGQGGSSCLHLPNSKQLATCEVGTILQWREVVVVLGGGGGGGWGGGGRHTTTRLIQHSLTAL